jgi:hypothetical protein
MHVQLMEVTICLSSLIIGFFKGLLLGYLLTGPSVKHIDAMKPSSSVHVDRPLSPPR